MRRRATGAAALVGACAAAGAAGAHDWYKGLSSPRGVPCCDGRDCAPAGHRYGPGTGGLEVEIDGRWVPVEPGSVLATPSPDGEAHACRRYLQVFGARLLRVFCVILPGES